MYVHYNTIFPNGISSLSSASLILRIRRRSHATLYQHAKMIHRKRLSLLPSTLSVCTVELLVQQMQEKIDVQPHITLKQVHILVIGELSCEQRVHWDLGTGARNLDASSTSLNEENANFVARYRKVDLVPVSIGCPFPRYQYTLI